MKALLLLSICLLSITAFKDFHLRYISKFKPVDEIKLTASACGKYACSPYGLPGDQCVYNKDNTNYLQPCPQGSFCPWSIGHHNTSCVEGSDAIGYGGNPGDVCESDDDCGGLSTCVKSVCVGFKTGHECNDQEDCDVGYACHNVDTYATCQPLNPLNGTCGDYLTMNLCKNTLGCNFGVCQNLFSKDNGEIVDEGVAGILCSSGFYVPSAEEGKAVCTVAPTSPRRPLPFTCSAGELCLSRDAKYAALCECGFNPSGQGYCPVFPGDALYQDFLNALKVYLTDPDLDKCHYLDIGMPSCQAVSSIVYETVASASLEVQYLTSVQSNDQCTKDIITKGYWY
jgi:hypothetical protein